MKRCWLIKSTEQKQKNKDKKEKSVQSQQIILPMFSYQNSKKKEDNLPDIFFPKL